MAAVAPQTILCGNERLYPAGSVVEAATTPSRCVGCNFGTVRCELTAFEIFYRTAFLTNRKGFVDLQTKKEN